MFQFVDAQHNKTRVTRLNRGLLVPTNVSGGYYLSCSQVFELCKREIVSKRSSLIKNHLKRYSKR